MIYCTKNFVKYRKSRSEEIFGFSNRESSKKNVFFINQHIKHVLSKQVKKIAMRKENRMNK